MIEIIEEDYYTSDNKLHAINLWNKYAIQLFDQFNFLNDLNCKFSLRVEPGH